MQGLLARLNEQKNPTLGSKGSRSDSIASSVDDTNEDEQQSNNSDESQSLQTSNTLKWVWKFFRWFFQPFETTSTGWLNWIFIKLPVVKVVMVRVVRNQINLSQLSLCVAEKDQNVHNLLFMGTSQALGRNNFILNTWFNHRIWDTYKHFHSTT